jgi:endoglucanase
MKTIIKSILTFLLLTGLSCNSDPVDDSDQIGAEHIITEPEYAADINRSLGRGVNLGNAMEAPSEGDWGMVVEEEFIQLISDAGFEAIRIPIRWNAHAQASPPYTITPEFFSRVDEIIGWAIERDLMIMINIHHYNELMQNPHQHRERFLALWGQIATHYQSYDNNLLFEMLNEPHDNLGPGLWDQFLKDVIDVIRETNPDKTLVIGTSPWGGFGGLEHLRLPENDRNLIVTVHYYNPFQFTHQGAGWAGEESSEWIGTTWTGTEEQKAAVDTDFDMVQQWAEIHNRPIHLGEFGAYEVAPDESRKIWTQYVREAAEKRGFSWAYWEFGAGFGIYDRDQNRWRNGLLESLLPESPEL